MTLTSRRLWRTILPIAVSVLLIAIISAAPSAAATLKVSSFPSGAQVIIDGVNSGKITPMNISLAEGNHVVTVQISGSGWIPDTRTISIVTGNNDLSVTLLQAPPLVVGAWFGIARPCPAPAGDSPDHAAFCTAVCGACPNAGVLPPEVPMMPTLHVDGTMIEDDAGEIGLYHTTAQGKWTSSAGDDLPDRPGTDRFKGTFLWFGQTPPAFGLLGNAVRTRLVTYSDPLDPDRMIGFIQPYFFPIATGGLVVVNPATDLFAGNHIPTIDPLASLPSGCDLAKGCLGTYHFIIRRIKHE